MKTYVSEGWWRRGGIHITIIMLKVSLVLAISMLIIYEVARQGASVEPRMTGLVIGLAGITTLGITILGKEREEATAWTCYFNTTFITYLTIFSLIHTQATWP